MGPYRYGETLAKDFFTDIPGFPVIGKWLGDDKLFTYAGFELGWPTDWEDFGDRWYRVLRPAYYLADEWAWKWWDVKLAAAVWFATGACGIGKDKLHGPNGWFYRFHVYYTVAKLMKQTKTRIPESPLGFKALDLNTDVKMWRDIFREHGQPSDGRHYARDEGPLGTYRGYGTNTMYWIDKKDGKTKVFLREREEKEYKYGFKHKDFFSPVNNYFAKAFHSHKYVSKIHWYTDSPSYSRMKENMYFKNTEWSAVIPDKSPGDKLTPAGTKLLTETAMVYTYCMATALVTPHQDNNKIIYDQFKMNIDSFIKGDNNRTTAKDLLEAYDEGMRKLKNLKYEVGYMDDLPKGVIKIPNFVFTSKPKESVTPEVKLLKPHPKLVVPKEVDRHKIHDPIEKISLNNLTIGTDLLIIAGVLFGTAIYIWHL